jgi:hypothetical protein
LKDLSSKPPESETMQALNPVLPADEPADDPLDDPADGAALELAFEPPPEPGASAQPAMPSARTPAVAAATNKDLLTPPPQYPRICWVQPIPDQDFSTMAVGPGQAAL